MPFSVSNRGDISPKFRSVVLLHLSLFLGELPPLLDHYLVTLAIQIIVVTFALAAYPAQAVLAPGTLNSTTQRKYIQITGLGHELHG